MALNFKDYINKFERENGECVTDIILIGKTGIRRISLIYDDENYKVMYG